MFLQWQGSNSLVAANISQSSVKYPTCSKMTSEKDELPQLKLISQKQLPELSKFSISDDGGTQCKTLCSIGEESSTMQQNAVKTTDLSNGNDSLPNSESSHSKQQQNDVNPLYGDGEHAKESLQMFDAEDGEKNGENNVLLQNRNHEAQRNSNAAGQVEHLDQKGDFSDDLVSAIKRIESRILAFQICSNVMDSTKNSAGHLTTHEAANSDSPIIQRNNGVSGTKMSSGKSLLEGHRLMNQKTLKPSCQDEDMISRSSFEESFFAGKESLSPSQTANQNYWLHNSAESSKNIDVRKQIGTQMVSKGEYLSSHKRIQNSEQKIAMIGSVEPLNKLVRGDAYFGSRASKDIQGLRVPLNQDNDSKKHSMLVSKTNRAILARKNPVTWSKTQQNPKEMSSESSYTQKSAGSNSIIARREKPPPHQMVMKPILLDQRSSEIKVNFHKHRDRRRTLNTSHLEPRKTRVLQQYHEREESSSGSNPDSDADSSRWSSQQGSANSSGSDSEDYSLSDEIQSTSSGRMVDPAYEDTSEETNNSYLEMEDDPSSRLESFKSYRHHYEIYPKKTTGRLRRLRNKLGLIFHHHHHHHHHHHDDHGNTRSGEGHGPTTWNHLQTVFHHKDKHEVLTEKVEKTKGGAAAKVLARRNQVGQFQRLAEGVLGHIRHSNKPKPSKLDMVKQSGNKPHGHNQKKLRWLQILRKQREVKMKNKGRVKMGFMSQNSLKNY